MSQSFSVPPYFDGSNYVYWKVRMHTFLKSLDEHVWVSVQNGWKPPSTIVSGTVNLTDISLWTKDEIAECNWNSKGLHALFMAVSPEEFRRVSMCESAKEVWDILEITHEGTKMIMNLRPVIGRNHLVVKMKGTIWHLYRLSRESLKIKNVNEALLKKVDELEREKERLASNLQDSLKSGSELKCINEKLEDKVKTLASELEKSNAHLQTFISGTKKLDNLLGMNKPVGDRRGLGYVKGNTHVARPSKNVFVSASKKSNAVSSSNKGKNVPREQSHQSRRNIMPKYPQTRTFEPRFIPTCHHCGALGHTRPRCYKLGNERRNQNIPSQVSFLSNQVSHLTEMLTKLTRSTLSPKKVWVKEGDLARHSGQEHCYVAHVALKAQNYNMWYLDSACSRHTCGNKALFTSLDECNGGMVIFGDGGSAPILGKGTVQMHGLPVISNVLYVEDLKSNLLSISQICDTDFEVSFVQKRCTVSAKIDASELWHKRLGYLNYKSLVQLAKKELVDGLPKIGPSENVVCGPCQLGKQLKRSHKKTSKI
ncbi:uncharacterized protein LOC111406778 [Olea europaea var. sylvestris]|uniref:uncharacterized protein LOC111406778 n=1 Tax=Olea europaea var. sylvestris TaxID=158386 RepID=UPI000C1CDC78|nr:uncharacterized protein LOC111406778 [Olea europaea var. sylvestris]